MSHIIEVTLEQKQAFHQSIEYSRTKIAEFSQECTSRVEKESWIVDDEITQTLASITAECEDAVQRLEEIDRQVESASSSGILDALKTEASSLNSVLLRTEALVQAMADSFQRHYLEPDEDFNTVLENVEEKNVKVMARLLHSNPDYEDVPADKLIEIAVSKVHPEKVVEAKHTEAIRKSLRKQMATEKVDTETVETIVGGNGPHSPLEMFNAAQNAISDERKRRSAINAIVKSITKRGFIIKKENIRHIRSTDTVKFVASKPGGQKAEFTIDINGRFAYKFEGYDGLACEKDISPLEHDLEEVYGFKLNSRNVVWSNPDKIMKHYHAAMNVKKDSRCRLPIHSTG